MPLKIATSGIENPNWGPDYTSGVPECSTGNWITCQECLNAQTGDRITRGECPNAQTGEWITCQECPNIQTGDRITHREYPNAQTSDRITQPNVSKGVNKLIFLLAIWPTQ